MDAVEPTHAGEQLRTRREQAAMTVAELADHARMLAPWLAALEQGVGTADVPYATWVTLVQATQPPRPDWWDEGYEHDLMLGADGYEPPTTKPNAITGSASSPSGRRSATTIDVADVPRPDTEEQAAALRAFRPVQLRQESGSWPLRP